MGQRCFGNVRRAVLSHHHIAQFGQAVILRLGSWRYRQRLNALGNNQRRAALIHVGQTAHLHILRRGVNPKGLTAFAVGGKIDDGVVEEIHSRQLRRNIRTRPGIKQREICGETGGPQHGHQHRGLVFAVAVVALENLGRSLRLQSGLAKLDSGVADLLVQAGDDPLNRDHSVGRRITGKKRFHFGRIDLHLRQLAVSGGHRGP